MKLHSLAIISLLGPIQAKLLTGGPAASTATAAILDTDGITRNLKLVECTVSEVHGFAPPGSPQVPDQYACTTDEGDALFFDGDASALFDTGFVSGETRLALAPQAMSSDGTNINVQQAIASGAAAVSTISGGRRKLTTTGTKSVLVVRVVSNDYAPSQSEAKMYDDVFVDDNNLRVRYDDCSNGALIFDPATGTDVNNGILTVNTSENLNGMTWQDCGTIATNGANTLGISRDFIMIVCPDVVDFEGAAAWGNLPGSTSWYKSSYASVPLVQMHEIGHNLGHHHSGKNGVTYADPTCNMGNQGSWSDAGTNFCFNAAKTWANKWYESYHVTVDPTNATYEGTLVGINAVKDGTITAGQDVVVKIASSGETDLYVMFNRKAGANSEVPQNGDQVVITEQEYELYYTSAWLAGLSETGVTTYTRSWSGSGTLTVKVCSLDTSSSGGTARILVYATGHATLSCDVSTPAPTNTPVTPAPTKATVTSPPVSAPVTPAPTKATVTSPPVSAPITPAPSKATVTSPPSPTAPTKAPVAGTLAPTKSTFPTVTVCADDDTSYTFDLKSGTKQKCAWFTKNYKNSSTRRNKYCFAADGVTASTIGSNCQYGCGFCSGDTSPPASAPSTPAPSKATVTSPPSPTGDTLSPAKAPTKAPPSGGCSDSASFKFFLDSGKTQNCAWLTKRNSVTRKTMYCSRGHVKGACQDTCGFCACVDDPTTTFPLLKNKDKSRNCAWIAKTNVANRQGNYCYDTVDLSAASDIGDSCVSSCGFCI